MNTHHTEECAGTGDKSLLKIDEVARHLNVSERHVRNLMGRKLIAYVRLGGALRFEPEEVQTAKRRMTVAARE